MRFWPKPWGSDPLAEVLIHILRFWPKPWSSDPLAEVLTHILRFWPKPRGSDPHPEVLTRFNPFRVSPFRSWWSSRSTFWPGFHHRRTSPACPRPLPENRERCQNRPGPPTLPHPHPHLLVEATAQSAPADLHQTLRGDQNLVGPFPCRNRTHHSDVLLGPVRSEPGRTGVFYL